MPQLRCCMYRLELDEDGPQLSCCECKFLFHLGVCSGVTEEMFNAKSNQKKAWKWKCGTCKGDNSKLDTEGQKMEKTIAEHLLSLDRKMDTLLTLPSKVEGLESSMQLLSDKFDEFHTRLITQEKLTKELTKRVEELENESPSRDLTQIKQDIDNLEYRSRRLNLEIHGIPASENEDLMAKVNEIAMKLQVPTVTRNDITNVHRLRAKVGKTPGVIVRFQNQEMRDKWLSKKNC